MTKKVILITGASSGIGKESAKQLVQEGHVVYAAARSIEKMEELKQYGIRPIEMDITKEEEVEVAVQTVMKEQGRIDVLFNNAGFGLYGAVEDIKLDDARYQFEVNIFGLAKVTQLVLPYMRKQGSGRIINTSSMGGKMYTPLGAWYHGTKHALEGWSDCLRLELEPFGIDVVIIEPGIILTEFGNVVGGPMLKVSGNGAYKEMAQAVAKGTENAYSEGGGSHPRIIAKVVSKAINTRKPKTRYVAGKLAKPLMLLRKYVSDRMFDKIVMSQVKSMSK